MSEPMTTPERLTPEQLEFAARCAQRGPQAYPSADGSIVEIDFQAMLRQAARDARTLQALRARAIEQMKQATATINGRCDEDAQTAAMGSHAAYRAVLAWIGERQP